MALDRRDVRRHRASRVFEDLLSQATALVGPAYFTLLTMDHVEPLSRERVYCYELYHQFRVAWPSEGVLKSYSINGEVDKIGHAAFAGRLCGAKPDFVVHVPGSMEHNLVTVEVKRRSATPESLREDLEKLHLMTTLGRYYRGILVVFGEPRGDTITPALRELSDAAAESCAAGSVQVWAHTRPLEAAIRWRGADVDESPG